MAHPIVDRDAARSLGAALRRLGYDEDAVLELLGDDAYGSALADDLPVHERRLPDTPLATVVRAFFLELPVSTRDAVRALGRRAVAALESTGLADVGDDVVPLSRIAPTADVLLASDRLVHEGEEPPDHVATFTPTSHLCYALTPRPRVARALDVGTGNGVHALLAARHAWRVVATDVNPRALAYTELNAALNEIENIDCRAGSLFEPAGDDTFDLITCNAPFVVSPEHRWAYRDGGLRGDDFSEQLVKGAAARLAEGGYATLLASWLATDENDPDERALAWVADSGCDGWLLTAYGWTPLEHAADWNAHLRNDRRAFGAVLDDWTRYLDGLGVSWVSEGAILLHRRPGSQPTVRADSIDSEAVEEAGAQIQRAFAARARLAELRRPADLLAARLAPAMPLRIETELELRGSRPVVAEARVHLAEGTHQAVETTAQAAEIIASLDGRARVRDAAETARLRRETLDLARELLELGALRFV